MGKHFVQGTLLAYELEEAEWYSAPQDNVAAAARAEARNLGCCSLVIFVIPDPLFSMCGHDRKHKVYEHQFPAADKPFKVTAVFAGEIDAEVYANAGEAGRAMLLRKTRDALNEYANGVAGRYSIGLSGGGKVLETGRV